MNLNDISTQLLFTTVPIWTEHQDGSKSAATAFFYNVPSKDKPEQSIPMLVTSHHVLKGASRAVIELIEQLDGQPVTSKKVRVGLDLEKSVKFADEKLDVITLPIGPIFNQLNDTGKSVFFRSVDPALVPTPEALKDLAAMEDVVFIGYPSGLRDEQNSTPLIRRGITSTPAWNDFQGEPMFLIDGGVFPGSSGSPVFILNQGSYPTREALVIGSRLLFLGIISQTIIRTEAGARNSFLNLGKVVRSDAVKNFVEGAVRSLPT